MELSTLQDRISNLKNTIEKKTKTIQTKTNLIAKKQKQLNDLGIDIFDKESIKSNNNAFWLAYDIETLEDDIKNANKVIEESKKKLADYEEQLKDASNVEDSYVREVPECLKELQKELEERWTEFDIARRDKILEVKKVKKYKDVMYTYSKYDWTVLAYKTDSEIIEDNKKDAKHFVIELFNRIKSITGEVTDWRNVELTYGARGMATLNGVVTGVNGKCRVESIFAEGSVQRLHVRVLTKRI